jgi:anhydro-N-acetylmuramic acid kinase
MRRELFAGVMSGTSLDGIDAVLAEFKSARPSVLAHTHIAFPSDLRRDLLTLQSASEDEIVHAARTANALSDLYVHALRSVCRAADVEEHDVVAAGVHGQTIRHRPQEGWTLQLNNPSRIAEKAYMTVVADFRMRDIAAGGQGAPLVPAFHAAMFAASDRHRVIANVGGIANVTDLPARGAVRGFDTGPGNVLLDLWIARHRNVSYDHDGGFAASGNVDEHLLGELLREPFFAQKPPKSTGRDLFNARWLDACIARAKWSGRAQDAQATLAALTARTLADATRKHCEGAQEVFVCGGGSRNADLMSRIAAELGDVAVATTDDVGIASEHVEALAFAWLARETIAGRAGNVPAVTGAAGPRVLGAIYPR